ncbi:MAG: YwaF family protein [Oscillospiraceae bacterium]|nr:YwaF family protein [Oscillospiraceae bacterium]
MYSTGHLIWIGISAVLIIGGFFAIRVRKPTLDQVLKACLIVGVVSEVTKVFSVTSILPMVTPEIAATESGQALTYVPIGQYTPYLKMEHLPLEMCSLMIVFLIAALLLKNGIWRTRLLTLMYITGTIGGLMGILLSYIATEYSSAAEFLLAPRAWQYFLYHSMVVTLGLYLGFEYNGGVSLWHWKSTMIGLLLLDRPTFYLNSVFSQPAYLNGEPVGILYRTNFFSSYVNPLGLVLSEKWQWFAYLGIRLLLATALITLMLWIPTILQHRKAKTADHTL